MPNKKTEGPRGTIWSAGIHQVYVNNKPARVYVPQATIPETYTTVSASIDNFAVIIIFSGTLPTLHVWHPPSST